ncbi:GNAT family N-acetyltransferase [Carnimonas bestiolae]|uniref:GNAT family N-acetyltransferase n=1 Tax=Carnimonas bestiolae TaxID=3402172 RepID=UPI003EDC1177
MGNKHVISLTEWTSRYFHELPGETLYALLKLRCEVFVVEQQCPYGDIDGIDCRDDVLHLIGGSSATELACYARLMGPGTTAYLCNEEAVSIGRVVCNPRVRGVGMGRQLMNQAIASCEDVWPNHAIRLSAQAHLRDFYASFGFVEQGDVFLEDGIPHIAMRRAVGSR